jgi:hypothetical protein
MRVISVFALFASCLVAQTASFEVVSVKPSGPDYQGMFVNGQPGGGIRIRGATVKNLIALAYNIREFQIAGAPTWAGTEHFGPGSRPNAFHRAPGATRASPRYPKRCRPHARYRQGGAAFRELIRGFLGQHADMATMNPYTGYTVL